MINEEYKQQKARAQQEMVADYEWILAQPPTPRQWRCPRRWLIEFVHDVTTYSPSLTDLHRPISLTTLYEQFFAHVGTQQPLKPAKVLNKLRTKEMLQGIAPDSVTLFYMQQMKLMQQGQGQTQQGQGQQGQGQQQSLSCHIIELLMESNGGSVR